MSQSLDRLYELLPAVYRIRDTEQGYPLRALLQVIAEQVNVVESDIAQLYENWFIETCEDWVVPYIADLIGYRPVSEAGNQSAVNGSQTQQLNKILIPRRDVADTIRNRRRKGALSLLENLAADVAGWSTRVVEFYKLLGWTQHLKHLRPLQGCTADLRNGNALDVLGSAFDSLAHTVDVRRIASNHSHGRYNIPGIGVFVWRLKSYSVTHTSAHGLDELGPHVYTFSPIGHNTQLYNRPQSESEPTHIAEELNLPVPIRRRAFEERLLVKEKAQEGKEWIIKEVERTQASADYYGEGKSLVIWAKDWPYKGAKQPVPRERIIPADLSQRLYRPPHDKIAVDPKLGRIVFPPGQLPRRGVKISYQYAFSADIGGGEYRRTLTQPEGAGVYRVSKSKEKPQAFRTLQEALSKWNSDKKEESNEQNKEPQYKKKFDAVIEICDSEVYTESGPLTIELPEKHSLQIRAANLTRPVLKILDYSEGMDALFINGKPGSRFTLDGLLVSGRGIQINGEGHEPLNEYDGDESPSENKKVQPYQYGKEPNEKPLNAGSEEDLCSVSIRHCTLVPGWDLERNCEPKNDEPSLRLNYTRAHMKIEHSIIGAIHVEANQTQTEPVRVYISDSIVDATKNDSLAICSPTLPIAYVSLNIKRCTVIGEVHVHTIELAENSIFDGNIRVARRQTGCVRFCSVRPGSRTPRRYQCQPDLAIARLTEAKGSPLTDEEKSIETMRLRPQFNSKRYGTPTYCQLAKNCADEIKNGADDESEMGVFHDLYQPQRAANLRARLDEFTPAGMEAGIIYNS
jgi:hypothetical protein